MTLRSLRIALALTAALALATAGSAIAGGVNVDKPGSGKKPYTLIKVKGKTGKTTLNADTALQATLDGVSVNLSAVAPATGSFDFPVTKSRAVIKKWNKGRGKKRGKKTIAGHIDHSGGLMFSRGSSIATISNLRIDFSAGKSGALTGKLSGARGRVRLGTLSGVSYSSATKNITIAKVTLTKKAADALNNALGIGGTLSKTTVLGSLVVDTTP